MSNELDMLQEDCNLDEIVDIDLDIDGKVMPAKNDKIALIDADTVAYTAALNSQEETELLPREFYTDEEWEELANLNSFDETSGTYRQANAEAGIENAKAKLQRILDKTGCKEVYLVFSGPNNFRYKVFPEYKATRDRSLTPAGLSEIRDELLKLYPGKLSDGWEADDEVVYMYDRDIKIRQAEAEELNNLAEGRILGDNKKVSGHHSSFTGKSKIYTQWDNMLDRCYGNYKPSIANYQDNGIKVYKPWAEDPNNYIDWALNNGWFEGCSIDRIDYLGHYIPSNIQFITPNMNTIKQILLDNPSRATYDINKVFEYRELKASGKSWKAILGEEYSEATRSQYSKQIKNIGTTHNRLEYLISCFDEGIRFKYDNIYYEVVNNKAKPYRNFIGAAIDKDLINSIATTWFNYYESALYNIEMKWVDVDRHTSLIWRYLQTLMGDTTDNIIGLKGIGPKKAEKILAGCFSHKELWEAVCNAYESKGRTRDEALMNLNLVDMKLLREVDGELKIILRTHKELLK